MSKAWISFSNLSKTAKKVFRPQWSRWLKRRALPFPFSAENSQGFAASSYPMPLFAGPLWYSASGPENEKKNNWDPGPFCEVVEAFGRNFCRCILFVWYKCCSPGWNVASCSCQWQRKETNLLEHWTEKMSSDFEIDVQLDVGDLAKIPWTLEHPMTCACRAQGDREGWLAHSSSGACIEENGLPVPTDVGGFYHILSMYRIRSSPPENERM